MAAAPPLSKAEYLKRYLSGADAGVDRGPESGRKRRKKRPKPGGAGGKGMRIVDDDVSWTAISTTKPEKEEEEDDGDLPVVAEFVDERPEEVKQMEAFRSSAKWKLLGVNLPFERRATMKTYAHMGIFVTIPQIHLLGESIMILWIRLPGGPVMTPQILLPSEGLVMTQTHLPGGPIMTPQTLHPQGGPVMILPILLPQGSLSIILQVYLLGESVMIHQIPLPLGEPVMIHQIPLLLGEPVMIHQIPLLLGEPVVIHQIPLLLGEPVMIHQIPLLLGEPIMIPQVSLPQEGPITTPLTHLNLGGLLALQTHSNSEGLVMTPLIWLLMSLIPCPEPKVVKPQKEPLARLLHIGRSQEPLIRHSQRTANMSMTLTSLFHEKSKQNRILETRSSLIPKSEDIRMYSRYFCHTMEHRLQIVLSVHGWGDCQKATDSDRSSPRHKQSTGHQDSDSDLSPPRNRPRHRSSDSDLSPPRRRQRTKSSDSDLSPPRRSQPPGKKAAHMYSGAKTGLVLTDIQREQQELKKQDQETMAFEAEFQYAETVFRDKSGRKRNLKLERLEQRRKAEKDSERDELYAQWGKGLAQSRQQQQNVEDAMKEMQKPLARYIDDEDLDRMLREQEREGDPMANFIKNNKAKENKNKKVRPRYSGPAPPPNRFNIWPGYRWDGVDRSNGFEQKRFARLASKKAVEELAYKWSVEDM
ncbi:BUD13-like protein [Plecturocebus cupreus]